MSGLLGVGLGAPKLDEAVVDPLTDEQLRAMLEACRGSDLRDKRDEAILRPTFTSAARAGEVVAMQASDFDLRPSPAPAIIRRGKGGKGRVIPLAVEVASAIDRYRRARKGHRLASKGSLWLGDRGKGFTYDALRKSLAMRAEVAGVSGLRPQQLRHGRPPLAGQRRPDGHAGWTRPDLLLRYPKAQASTRAAEEAQWLDLGSP